MRSLPQDKDSAVFPAALALAAIALGQAIQIQSGMLHPHSVVWLTFSILFCGFAVAFPHIRWMDYAGELPALWVAMIGIAGQLVELLTDRPASFLQLHSPRGMVPFITGIVLAAIFAGSAFSERSWFGRARMPILFLIHLALGIWLIRKTPSVLIDVDMFQRDSLKALLRGVDPYAIDFPDMMAEPALYGPTVSVNGRLTIGFPYPPLSLLLALPGHLIGDYRYSQLLAITGAGALMAYARPTRLAGFAATLFLFTPRVFFVLEQGWTEPFVVLTLAAGVFAACRAPKFLPIAMGLFLASKQYSFFALPLVALLQPRPFRWRTYIRVVGISVLIALSITLPFFLWNVRGFWRSIIVFQILQPFRSDALSYLSWFARDGQHWPQWPAFVIAALAAAFGIWRVKRTPAGFAAAAAFTFVLFFAFSKQAFCNYYFFVIGALCMAMSATSVDGLNQLPSNFFALFKSLPLKEQLFVQARLHSAPLHVLANKAPSGLVADIGCGNGIVTALLAVDRPDRRVIGIDPDDRKLSYARMGPGRLANVDLRQATLSDLTAEYRRTLDGIVVADVLYLLPVAEWNQFLATCFQLLKPGGLLLLKEAVDDGSWKYFKCRVQEEIMVNLLRKTQSSGGLNFMPRAFMETLMTGNGFSITEFLDLSRGYTTPHVLWIAVRP